MNTNKDIIALASGPLNPTSNRDILFIGSKTNLLVFDVEDNSDIFDREVSDGVHSLLFANMAGVDDPMVITGGNCSITGFDHQGDEAFWTVTGDNAMALETLDIDNDGVDELLVGSDDYSIRAFKGEEEIFNINEKSKIGFLSKVVASTFCYALANG